MLKTKAYGGRHRPKVTLSCSKIRTCLISMTYVNSLNVYRELILQGYSGEIKIEKSWTAHLAFGRIGTAIRRSMLWSRLS